MSSFLILNTLLLASAWLFTVFGDTPCTIPWYNYESPPLSEISGYCVPKGDREACPHAVLLPASSGACPGMSRSTLLTEARWHEAQECCVAIKCGVARILPQNAESEISFCLNPLQTDCEKIGGDWISFVSVAYFARHDNELMIEHYRDAICLGASPTSQNNLICCSLQRPTKPDDTCDTDERLCVTLSTDSWQSVR